MLTVAQSVKLMMRDAATGRYKNYTSQKNASFEHRAAITSIIFFGFIVVGLKWRQERYLFEMNGNVELCVLYVTGSFRSDTPTI